MKERLLLLIAAILFTIGIAEGKIQKIKYGKYVYYEGEVVDKQPMGNGNLVLVSPTDKKQNIATITGDFKDGSIYKAEIKSSLLPSITRTGTHPYKLL